MRCRLGQARRHLRGGVDQQLDRRGLEGGGRVDRDLDIPRVERELREPRVDEAGRVEVHPEELDAEVVELRVGQRVEAGDVVLDGGHRVADLLVGRLGVPPRPDGRERVGAGRLAARQAASRKASKTSDWLPRCDMTCAIVQSPS